MNRVLCIEILAIPIIPLGMNSQRHFQSPKRLSKVILIISSTLMFRFKSCSEENVSYGAFSVLKWSNHLYSPQPSFCTLLLYLTRCERSKWHWKRFPLFFYLSLNKVLFKEKWVEAPASYLLFIFNPARASTSISNCRCCGGNEPANEESLW